jgi:hypothetical protein
MRVIRKQISLEQFKSRMPSIIPAYDGDGVQHDFIHITDLETEPLVNYGMLPFDVQTDKGLNLGKYEGVLYTFKQLIDIYHELDKAYTDYLDTTCTQQIVLSEEDENMYNWLSNKCFPYFIFDIEFKKDNVNIKDIKKYWGKNKLSIQEVSYWFAKMSELKEKCDLDSALYCCECDEYEKRGGETMLNKLRNWYNSKIKPILCNINDYGHDFVYDVKESDTHVTVKVLKTEEDGTIVVTTHTFQIYEPRVRIFGNNRYIKYGEITYDGKVTNPKNIEIIDGVLTIPCLDMPSESILIISEPSITIPITLNNSMENLGEMTSICEPWDSGLEYNLYIDNKDDIDYSGGVLAYYNNDNWILKSYANSGYIYSTKYREVYFGTVSGMTAMEIQNYKDEDNIIDATHSSEEQWVRYFDYLPKKEEIIINDYAYKDTKLILNPNPYEMGYEHEINTNEGNGYCLKNSKLCQLFNCEYIELNGSLYEIFYVFNKVNPYIIVDRKRVWLNFVGDNKVTVKTNTICSTFNKEFTVNSGLCFSYDDKLYEKNDDIFLNGYCNINGDDVYFSKLNANAPLKEKSFNKKSYLGEYVDQDALDNQLNSFSGYTTYIISNKNYVRYSKPYQVFSGKYVRGNTSSRLEEELKDNLNMAVDNLGNRLKGLMPYKTINVNTNEGIKSYQDYIVNPAPNDWLSIPYIPQFVSNLTKIEDDTIELYWGNIISKIIFSFQERQGNEYTKKVLSATTNTEMKRIEEELHTKNGSLLLSDLKMDVEYYIGTLLEKTTDGYSLFKGNTNDDLHYYGIKYYDTFKLEAKQCIYYFDEMYSCILNYFDLIANDIKPYINESYNVIGDYINLSSFEFIIKPFDLQYGYLDYSTNEPIFYKVNELDETIKVQNGNNIDEYPIEFKGAQKYFTMEVLKNAPLYKEYVYYCIRNNKKYYAECIESGNNFYFKIKFNDDEVFVTNGGTNDFKDDGYSLVEQIYCLKPLKLYLITSNGTFDEYFDYTNNMSLSPCIFSENKLGFASPEKSINDIYRGEGLNRGTVRALDFHLRLLESKSLESLEQIGNGFFTIKSNNEN